MGFLTELVQSYRQGNTLGNAASGGRMYCVHCNATLGSVWVNRCHACHLNPWKPAASSGWGGGGGAGGGLPGNVAGTGRSGGELLFFVLGRLLLLALIVAALPLVFLALVVVFAPGLAAAAVLVDFGVLQASPGTVWGVAVGATAVGALLGPRNWDVYLGLVVATGAVYLVAAFAGWGFAARHWTMLLG